VIFRTSIPKNILKAFFGVREAVVDPEENLVPRNSGDSCKELNHDGDMGGRRVVVKKRQQKEEERL